MSTDEEASDYDGYLHRESLRLKHLINIACGTPVHEWPPENQDWDWEGCLDDLHFAIQRGDLEGIIHPRGKRHDRVRLQSLSEWLTAPERVSNPRWEPMHEVIRRRAKVCVEALYGPDEPQPVEAKADNDSLQTSETRRDQRHRRTLDRYQQFYDLSQAIIAEGIYARPTEIAKAVAKRYEGPNEKGVNAKNIRRRLDEHFRGWSTPKTAQQKRAQKVGANS